MGIASALLRCAVLEILMYYVYIPVSVLRAPYIALGNHDFPQYYVDKFRILSN